MKAISLFSGAGGMDLGFKNAGFEVVWANDFDKTACDTFELNHLGPIQYGSIDDYVEELCKFRGVDLVFGGPPCQGFSVAGKMDPDDKRSRLVFSFCNVVAQVQPRAFVMENVKALGINPRWAAIRNELIHRFQSMGYSTNMVVLNATKFGVPQKRERVFICGFKEADVQIGDLVYKFATKAPTVREALSHLDPAGTGNNIRTCKAEITLASNPIMRKSPYAGMIFNGAGRPIDLEGAALTLPASMGGNKTPIIDSAMLLDRNHKNWVVEYHTHLMNGGAPYDWKSVPKHLRRITVDEALAIQSFPKDFKLAGKGNSAAYRLIGNAVPPLLAEAVAKTVKLVLSEEKAIVREMFRTLTPQPELFQQAAGY